MIKSIIGQGAYSKIYETNRENIVAKEIYNWNELNNFDHPNIIKPIDCILENIQYYMLLPKLTQWDILTNTQLIELHNAIVYIHNKGGWHGDIHMDNIMQKDGKLYLIDFGNYCDKDSSQKQD